MKTLSLVEKIDTLLYRSLISAAIFNSNFVTFVLRGRICHYVNLAMRYFNTGVTILKTFDLPHLLKLLCLGLFARRNGVFECCALHVSFRFQFLR